jgi:hypothetical protein
VHLVPLTGLQACRAVGTPWSIFSEQNRDFLVSFQRAATADIKRLRQLEHENGRLKKMVADRDLEIDVLKEITRKKW